MRLLRISCVTLLLASCSTAPKLAPPPETERRPAVESLHGVELVDPYQWLEDQQAPETRAWIDRQNAYTDSILGNRSEAALFAPRIEQLLKTDDFGTPWFRGGRYFYTRRGVEDDLHSIYMRESLDGADELLIDATKMSADKSVNAGIRDASDDGKLLAYYVRKGGADEVEIRFFDVDARRDVGTPLPRARYYGIDVAPDRTLFYSRMDADGPRVYRRAFAGGAEEKLFGDGYTREKIITSQLSDGGRYLVVQVWHGSAPKKTELYVDDLRDEQPMRTASNDLEIRSTAEMAGDTLVIQTNWNAPNERVMTVSASDPRRENWKELVPENPNAAIQGMSLAAGRVFVRYLQDVKPRLIGYDLTGAAKDNVRFDTLGDLGDASGTWDTPVAFFKFSSFHVPPTIYQYDPARSQRGVFARQSVPVREEDVVVEQQFFTSKDGTRVPMFVLYRKGLARNGKNPAYMTGYGGFLQSSLPAFSPRAVSWAENGGVYAVVNLRGGGEFGETWHQAGMLATKQNTFDDFISAAEHLIAERFTSSEHLGIAGGSNGGLLVMAAATQRPDLFGAVICRYPLIDMLRYHKFLVGSFWVPEYGDPEKPEDFRWLYAYSPYHHVRQGTKYPATLFITGDGDTRVAPLHARKMTALMQWANGGDEPMLLRYHVALGHSGGEPRSVTVKNQAEELGFLWWQLR